MELKLKDYKRNLSQPCDAQSDIWYPCSHHCDCHHVKQKAWASDANNSEADMNTVGPAGKGTILPKS